MLGGAAILSTKNGQIISYKARNVIWALASETLREYGVVLSKLQYIKNDDCIIVAVTHNEFKN